MFKRFTFDYVLTKIFYLILDYRSTKRSVEIKSFLKGKTSKTNYRFIDKRQSNIKLKRPGTQDVGVTFYRYSDDVTYVPEALFHIRSPWDDNPFSGQPKIAALIYEWKQIQDVTYSSNPIEEDASEQMLKVKRELELHIESLLKSLMLSS